MGFLGVMLVPWLRLGAIVVVPVSVRMLAVVVVLVVLSGLVLGLGGCRRGSCVHACARLLVLVVWAVFLVVWLSGVWACCMVVWLARLLWIGRVPVWVFPLAVLLLGLVSSRSCLAVVLCSLMGLVVLLLPLACFLWL